MKNVDKFGSNSLLTRMTNDVDNVQTMIVLFCQLIFPAPIISLFALVMTFSYSVSLAWVTLASIVFYLVVVYFLMKKVPFIFKNSTKNGSNYYDFTRVLYWN